MRPLLPLLAVVPVLLAQDPPDPAREFRGAWVATVDNIDWPSKPGLPVPDQRQELDRILDRAQALGLNALVFQVRPHGDAMYDSELEPWSEWLTGEQGKPPQPRWDPLQHAVAGAHARGLELHAWFNPFRARHSKSKSRLHKTHLAAREPALAVEYGGYLWFDPGEPKARDHALKVIVDVVARYDLDGIQVDDYFYPYPVGKTPFPDDASYQRYQKQGGKLARDDWRRQNIDDFVARMRAESQKQKPWVKVGISPFGIARPGVPQGTTAGIDQYAQLYADTEKWLREGWCDYFAPQLYWPIDQKPQSFAVLLPWWTTVNPQGRHLWPGLSAGRALQASKPWRDGELGTQIDLIRAQAGSDGFVLFSFKALQKEHAVSALLRERLAEPALVPASPWLGSSAPAAPKVTREGSGDGLRVIWQVDATMRFAVVQTLGKEGGQWQTRVVDARAGALAMPPGTARVSVRFCSRTGILGPAAAIAF